MNPELKLLSAIRDYLIEQGLGALLKLSYADGDPVAVAVPCVYCYVYGMQYCVKVFYKSAMVHLYTATVGKFCNAETILKIELSNPELLDAIVAKISEHCVAER